MPRTFRVALYAADDEKRVRGLIFTDPRPDDQCALFVFPRPPDTPGPRAVGARSGPSSGRQGAARRDG